MKKKYYNLEDLPEILGISASEYLEYEAMQDKFIGEEEEMEALIFEQRISSKNLLTIIGGKNG